MSLWWNQLYKTSSDGNVGALCGWRFVYMQKGCEEILVFDSDCRPKLLANLSNQDHIVRVGHGMNLRILSRPDPLFFFLV